MWHFLFALFRFQAILIKFRFLFLGGLFQTLENSTPGQQEAEKLAGSGGKKSSDYLKRSRFQSENKKKTLFHYIQREDIYMKCIQLRSIANINQDFIFRLGKLHNSYFIYTMKVSGKIIDASGLDMSLSIADIYGTTTPFKC